MIRVRPASALSVVSQVSVANISMPRARTDGTTCLRCPRRTMLPRRLAARAGARSRIFIQIANISDAWPCNGIDF
jgi:hypothetical protein